VPAAGDEIGKRLVRDPSTGGPWAGAEELRTWDQVSQRLTVTFLPDGMMNQFEGYGQLAELDWEDHRERYGKSAGSISSWKPKATASTGTRHPNRPMSRR